MSGAGLSRLAERVAGTPLEGPLADVLPTLGDGDAAGTLEQLDGPMLGGFARAVAGRGDVAGLVGHRPELAVRIASASAETLAARTAELASWAPDDPEDLEAALDALRLLRREETCLAASIAFAELVPFSVVSEFLSVVAETVSRAGLDLARRSTPAEGFVAVGMGKIAGREFTFHSDLDVVFLYEGGPEAVSNASRVGQRMISYLNTMTGAGIAYAVDTRLRPSGGQGMLVTSLAAFERYQCEEAQTWEHVAMLRARPIAGEIAGAEAVLARVRKQVLESRTAHWAELAPIRERAEKERSSGSDATPFKTGAGGLMDVDFLAGGGLLERGPSKLPALPAVPELLRAAVSGPRVEVIVEDYAFLRRVEAAARWWTGRAVEVLEADCLGAVAELAFPGRPAADLAAELDAARARIRSAWRRVVEADSIGALED